MGAPLSDFVGVIRRILKLLRYASFLVIGVTFWVLGREVATLHAVVRQVHWTLGWVYLAAVAVVAWRFLGVPIWRYLKVPVVVRPPKVPDKDVPWSRKQLEKRFDFLGRYLAHLRRNPILSGAGENLEAAVGRLGEAREKAAALEEVDAAVAELTRFEKLVMNPLLAPLDREADRVIRAEALGVGIATALSPNGTLDSFIVLWRNANLVSRVANIYYGRPGPRGSLRILRDVSAAALLATYLEGLTEAAGGVLRGIFGSVAGFVAGPVLDGGVNAVATLRIGYLARARCRSFKAWTDATRREALQAALRSARERSKDVVAELARRAGAGLAGLGGKVGDAMKGGLSAFFKRFKHQDDEPGPAPAG